MNWLKVTRCISGGQYPKVAGRPVVINPDHIARIEEQDIPEDNTVQPPKPAYTITEIIMANDQTSGTSTSISTMETRQEITDAISAFVRVA